MIVRESTKSKRMTILGTVAFMGENMHVQYVCMYVYKSPLCNIILFYWCPPNSQLRS